MKQKKTSLFPTLCIALSFLATLASAQRQFLLDSPNGKITIHVSVDKTVEYSVSYAEEMLLLSSPLSMTLGDGRMLGKEVKIGNAKTKSVNRKFDAIIYKRAQVVDHYNELEISFRGDYGIVFRAYNDGVAYRFKTRFDKPFIVHGEQVAYRFPSDNRALVPYVKYPGESLESQFKSSFENLYDDISLSQWSVNRLAFLPLVVSSPSGIKMCITEADLFAYPGMYLHNGNSGNELTGVFAPYPAQVEQGGWNNMHEIVLSREDYIARSEGRRSFPWRAMIIAVEDKDLADNDMVYKLARPADEGCDWSWVRPGKVAWEWWNDWNLYGVDFRAGINNETYQYYIDFAANNGIEYVILDDGWALNSKEDLFRIVPDIDMEMLIRYAQARHVGLILWAAWKAFDNDMERACCVYSQMGIKGFKIDFMDRDDQCVVDFHTRAAETGARYKLLIDFHGTYKPTGLQRTYPNVVNFEGVHGLEQMKVAPPATDQIVYDLQIPFIRMVAGPMDYTQGAMRNANKENFRAVYSEAMNQGTRCRQLAQYIIFESPLTMLCDSPSNYMREEECLGFISEIPTIWDNSLALNGEISRYITLARQKGEIWYIGSMTDWEARKLELDLSFIGEGDFEAEIFRDGINADRAARDYKKETIEIPKDRRMQIVMASGGGFAMKVYRK